MLLPLLLLFYQDNHQEYQIPFYNPLMLKRILELKYIQVKIYKRRISYSPPREKTY